MLNFFRGREAVAASTAWNIAKTLSQTIIFWTVFLGLLPWAVLSLETALGLSWWKFEGVSAQVVGGILFVLGGALGLTSGIVMAARGQGTPLPADCPRALVVVGPYRYLRNPMAVAGLSQGIAVGIILGSPAVVIYALCGAPVWDHFVRPWEEADLERRFGDDYRRYRAEVRCWLPRLRGYR